MHMKHEQNKNISLTLGSDYLGLPIQTYHGPLAIDYLQRLHSCLFRGLSENIRVFAFRVDLRLPHWAEYGRYLDDNSVLERFIASFKAKIRHNRSIAKNRNNYAHDTSVLYVWAREIATNGRPHYHIAILLNNDAFCTLGQFELGRNNLYNRLVEAWSSALDLLPKDALGLVEIPANHDYLIHRNDRRAIEQFFYRASYLCKAATKQYGNGCHGFGASRIQADFISA